jgi:multidrug resistance protein, MATE family
VVVLSVLGVGAYMLDGIFIGATGTREMRNTVLLAVAIYGLLLWLAVPVWGNPALWGALMVLNLLRGVFLAALYPSLERRVARGLIKASGRDLCPRPLTRCQSHRASSSANRP